jgi:iron complex outermembrane receptor protein
MNVNLNKSTMCVAIVLGTSIANPVGAQGEPSAPAQSETTTNEQSTPESSEITTSNEVTNMETVVVTARRIQERAQDVPISMTIFTPQALTAHNVTDAVTLATYTPSLSTNPEFGSEGTSFAIRGFRQEIGTTASVAVYFADVVAPRGGSAGVPSGDGAGPGSFFDLQNVQVLKGPQGTLFGRNTDGGAVLLVPQRPTSELGGFVTAAYGNHDMLQVQGVLNLPVTDTFRTRFAIDHENRDGYIKNLSGIGPSAFNDLNYTALRASAVWEIMPSLENYTIATFADSDHNGTQQKLFACNPAAGLGGVACLQLANNSSQDFFTAENDLPFAASKMQQWQLINTTAWTQSDNLTIKNITSYARLTNTVYNDLFGTNFVIPLPPQIPLPNSFYFNQVVTAPGHKLNDMADMTEELQFQGRLLNDRLTWQSGLYAEFNEPQSATGPTSGGTISCTDIFDLKCTDLLGTLGGAPGSVGTVNYQVGRSRFHDYGIYEQANYALTDKLKLTEGLRYTMDSSQAHYDEALYYFPAPNTPTIYCATPSAPHSQASGDGPAPSVDSCAISLKQDSKAPTWLLGLDYKLAENNLLYFKYSRGYRQGSVSPQAPEGYQTFSPEKVDSYELGSKNSFNGFMHGTFNVAAFYNDFRDQQISEGFLCPNFSDQAGTPAKCGVSGNLGIVNAGKSRMYGMEIESALSLYKGLTLDLSYAYLNTKLVSIDIAPIPMNSPFYGYNCDNTGNNCVLNAPRTTADVGGEIPLTPKNKLTSTATYVLPLSSEVGKVSVAANYTYQSGMIQSGYESTPYYKSGSFGLTNLNFDWTAIKGSRFDAGLFATNVFNQRYYTFISGLYNGGGLESGDVGEPRMFGGRVRMNFGD